MAAFVDMAGHGIDLDEWVAHSGSVDQSVFAAARRFVIKDPTWNYHYSKACVLEVDGEIAGGLIGSLVVNGSPTFDLAREYIKPLLVLESRLLGFWSILGVAVYPEFRGRGLTRLLLDHARILGRQAGATGLSLVVEDTNEAAVTAYRRYGFQETERLSWISYRGRTGPKFWLMLTLSLAHEVPHK
ncbi:GNAT family N-acetyltransferase [Mesorhizobium sp. M0199]|uniref:GNAT family N-acetyltransferase n=1 Tax=Mesorhizobium sp. M0199 TaxID=2956911 RepID=UPI00333CE3B1